VLKVNRVVEEEEDREEEQSFNLGSHRYTKC